MRAIVGHKDAILSLVTLRNGEQTSCLATRGALRLAYSYQLFPVLHRNAIDLRDTVISATILLFAVLISENANCGASAAYLHPVGTNRTEFILALAAKVSSWKLNVRPAIRSKDNIALV